MSDWSSSRDANYTASPNKSTTTRSTSSPVAKQMSVTALKIKAMRQVLRSSAPSTARGAMALDLLLLLKELPAGVLSRVTSLATTFSFPQQAPLSSGNPPNNDSSSSAPSSGDDGDKKATNSLKAEAVAAESNKKSIPLTPLGTPVKQHLVSNSSSLLKNMIEINSQNNRVIESRMLSELTREQLLSSSQEEEVNSSSSHPSSDQPHPPGLSESNKWSSSSSVTPSPGFLETNAGWQNIEARTKHLMGLVAKNSGGGGNGNSKHNLITHLDELFSHIYQHHDTRLTALQGGGVKILGKVVKLHENDVYIVNKAREVLALLGHNPPTKGQGIKILAIDGGGVRGLVALEVLRAMERITGKRTYELFDYICGVSTGSILAFLLGAHKKTLDEAEVLYKDLSREIFAQNSFLGSAALLWSHSYYHTPTFEKILKKHCGELPLISLARDPQLPRVSAISTVVNQERVCPYVFRTYALPPTVRAKYLGGCRYHMWEAVRASAAAPTYFEEIKLGNYLHQDGGVLCNNPTSVAISEARTIWQDQPLQCVVSLGTGLTLSNRSDKNINDLIEQGKEGLSYLSWKGKFLKVLDSATDTESVHNTLNELLPHSIYFRLNPYLSDVVRLDEGDPAKLAQVQQETRAYLERNVEKVSFACKTLLREKGMGKKVVDWWYHA